ncbi:uncharacterized protein [Pleurodeles waltl]
MHSPFAVLLILGTFASFSDSTLADSGTDGDYKAEIREAYLAGVNSLEALAESLLSLNITEKVYAQIQEHLSAAHGNMKKAEDMALAKEIALRSLHATHLTELRRLSEEQISLGLKLDGANTELNILLDLENSSQTELERAKQNLEYSISDLQKMEQEKTELEEARDEGNGVFLIPSSGKLIGLSMITANQEALDIAKMKADEAKRSFHAQTSAVVNYSEKVEGSKEKIVVIEESISKTQEDIDTMKVNISQEVDLLEKLTSFQLPVRQCTAFLSVLVGKSFMANVHAALSAVLDALLPALSNMEVLVSPLISYNPELHDNGSSSLNTTIGMLNQANEQLKNMSLAKQPDIIHDFL